jgi:hypothetical protein
MRKDGPTVHKQHKAEQAADNQQGHSNDFPSHFVTPFFASVLFLFSRHGRTMNSITKAENQ